ncbi:MAG: hypothetical protein IKT58_04605 [Oscillospiraceae bacterium]|nr:hypothetical protein [Oscillospiraceae bacterium]
MRKFSRRFLSLLLAVTLLSGCIQMTFAATPSSTSNASATLAYTLKGLPLGRAIQNFYVGATYIYITQRVDATTYVSRLKINGAEANYMDRMTFNNCGHGQSLDFYTYGGKEYLLMGCKAETATTYNWSLQMARFQYEKGLTYDYTDLNRLSYMNYANKSASRLGTTYRVAGAASSSYMIFRIQTEEGTVTYSAYSTSKLNALLDASESVRMDSADAKAACSFSFTQSGSNIIRPNGSFQGIDISSTKSIYLTGGADGDTPQIARMNSSGSYLKLIKVTNVGNLEIEGVQCKNGNVYFVIVPSTVAADKKEKHKIYYIPEKTFGITHTIETIAGTPATCTSTGKSSTTKCTTCSQYLDIQEVLPKLEHTVVNVPAVEATCVSAGMTAGTKCSVCNTILSGCTTVPAGGHKPQTIPGTAATCTEAGITEGSTCTLCGVVLTAQQAIPASGHTVAEIPAVEATCTTSGVTAGTKCSTCNVLLSGCTEVPATGHTEVVTPGTPATCLSSGLSDSVSCGACGIVLAEQTVLPRLGHDYSYTDKGATHEGQCTRCSKTVTEDHSYKEGLCICGAVEQTEAIVDNSIQIQHGLNLASDISVNFVVRADLLSSYDSHSLLCTLPVYEGNTLVGSRELTIEPELKGYYYYYTLTGLTAVNMGDTISAQLRMSKDGKFYVSNVDEYSVATYAYAQLDKSTVADELKTLCADLLRYGAMAQTYKTYRTDSLVDGELTDAQQGYLSNMDAVTFANCNETLADLASPSVAWVGKTLDLNSKVTVKYVFDLSGYAGDPAELSLKISYVNYAGQTVTATVGGAEPYSGSGTRYSISFDGLLAAELRSVVDAAVYVGDTRLSQTLRYSPDTYGTGKTGTLGDLCKALFAYSDSAKSYFTN